MKKAIIWAAINALSIYMWTSLAFLERGYSAVGGEWMVIILIGFLSAYKLKKARIGARYAKRNMR